MNVAVEPRSRLRQFLLLVPVGLASAGCSLIHDPVPAAMASNPVPGDKCAEVMREALAGGELEITQTGVVNDTPTTATATLAATRSDIVESAALARDVAAECKFDHGVLMDFHWTLSPFPRSAAAASGGRP